jgi:hypothetical protein
MKFVVEFTPVPKDGGEQFTVEQVTEHLKHYTFLEGVEFEICLLVPYDTDHEEGTDKDYRIFTVENVSVVPVREVEQ